MSPQPSCRAPTRTSAPGKWPSGTVPPVSLSGITADTWVVLPSPNGSAQSACADDVALALAFDASRCVPQLVDGVYVDACAGPAR